MQKVISLLKTILPVLNLAQFFLENLDTNDTGTDDEFAKELRQWIDGLIRFITDNTNSTVKDTVIKGLTAIDAYGRNLIDSLKELRLSAIAKEEKIAQAKLLIATLYDSSKVYQPKKGDDKDALERYKAEANELLKTF